MSDNGKVVNTKAAARILELSVDHLLRLVRRGDVPAIKTGKGYQFEIRELKVVSSSRQYNRKLSVQGRKHLTERAKAIVDEELGDQAFVELLDGARSVGVMGDRRTVGHTLVISFPDDPQGLERIGHEGIRKVSTRLTNEVYYPPHHPIVRVTVETGVQLAGI